jgi:hypothetical protein
MTRPKKQHRPGGIHYVVLFGNGGQEIFQDDADKQYFTELLAVARARCNAEIFAFCLTRRDARLVVRVSDVPVGRLVQRVATQYSRNNHAKYATAGYLFQHPYRAYLLEGTTHLLEIVRHVHLAPLEMGVTADIDSYRWCSHRAYVGLESLDWLNRGPVLELLAGGTLGGEGAGGALTSAAPVIGSAVAGGAPPAALHPLPDAQGPGLQPTVTPAQTYQQLMSVRHEPVATGVALAGAVPGGAVAPLGAAPVTGLAPDDSPPRSQLPSDDHFFSWLRRHAGKPPATVTVDQVIQAVAKKMGVDRKRLLSTSRERRLTLTRALIGWHVTKNQIATLTEVSRQLGRDPSSVYTAYARYRAWRPQLFRDSLATILQYLEPDDPARDTTAVKKH